MSVALGRVARALVLALALLAVTAGSSAASGPPFIVDPGGPMGPLGCRSVSTDQLECSDMMSGEVFICTVSPSGVITCSCKSNQRWPCKDENARKLADELNLQKQAGRPQLQPPFPSNSSSTAVVLYPVTQTVSYDQNCQPVVVVSVRRSAFTRTLRVRWRYGEGTEYLSQHPIPAGVGYYTFSIQGDVSVFPYGAQTYHSVWARVTDTGEGDAAFYVHQAWSVRPGDDH